MSALKLALVIDANNPVVGDIYLGSNRSARLTSTLAEEVIQWLYTNFRFFKGEWFRDSTIGVPYYQSILGQKVPLSIVTRILRGVVDLCPGVKSVDSFSVSMQPGRIAIPVFSLTLNDGTTLKSTDFPQLVIGG